MSGETSAESALAPAPAEAAAAAPSIDRDPSPSGAPPSSSGLSNVPNTDSEDAGAQDEVSQTTASRTPQLSAQTEELVKRINANAASAAKAGTPGYDAAREQVMRDMATTNSMAGPPSERDGADARRRSNGHPAVGWSNGDDDSAQTTPVSGARGRGRGRGGGRPRGRARGSGRAGKRKREHGGGDDDDGASDSDEVITPVATMTKSGRSINKPTTFVPPPPPSPAAHHHHYHHYHKRKRTYTRNPQSAVCKTCLRGTTPSSNMIVFCDGCNAPYHRFCHHPPIDQSVIDEVDKEWYCRACELARVEPVPDSEVADFVSVPGVSLDERKRYFSTLPAGVLATLLTRATLLHPDLPVFAPGFGARVAASNSMPPPAANTSTVPNGHSAAPLQSTAPAGSVSRLTHDVDSDEEMAPYGHQHPPNYPRPGHGLMSTLPPDKEDPAWLVDDEDEHRVFTHLYRSNPAMPSRASANPSIGQITG